MKIALACDHAGFALKDHVAKRLSTAGHEIVDFGTHNEDSVDFVDHVYPAALALSEAQVDRALLIDGAGYPSGIVANMLPGVFAAVANDPVSARLAREHSNTNALCLGGRIVGSVMADQIVDTWLTTDFLGGKYGVRVDKVRALDAKHRRSANEQARKVVTVNDVRDALRLKRSLLLDDKTILTPSVKDLLGEGTVG